MIPLEELVLMVSRLVLGAIVTFVAILLWSRTRDSAWMFIILGTILQYGEIMVSTFEIFGIVSTNRVILWGLPVAQLVLTNLPLIFYGIGLIIAVQQTRLH